MDHSKILFSGQKDFLLTELVSLRQKGLSRMVFPAYDKMMS
ncbi:hypothetical protein HMPREF1557_01380 [Streptococcus sobrinus W1703]|uniref:Uncharacterized protein n=1 Tax=Streptococcus sobrinus W1703 TaxID=1227275 RepID=U2KJ82_9STRE|nr:hypothetical protein HMPREF1557_01380 [Streptococcus sobrinus W1703]